MRRLIFGLLGALLVSIPLSMMSLVAAQDMTPDASPAMTDCVAPEVPPGTPTPMEESASPEAGMDATPEEMGPPEAMASPDIPVGEPASDDVAAGVEAAIMNAVACANSSDLVAFAALFSPDGLMDECGTTNIYDAPVCFEGIPQITNVEVSDVQTHDDGRVSADLVLTYGSFVSHERQFLVMADDGSYLLDVSPELPVEIPDGATVIDGEMVDFEFKLSETSAPAGDIAFTVTNAGEYPHEMIILQMPEGVTVDALLDDESLFEQVQFLGFTFAEPGETASPLVLVNMQPGTYTIVCFVDVPDGVPHVMRGMVLEFEVTD